MTSYGLSDSLYTVDTIHHVFSGYIIIIHGMISESRPIARGRPCQYSS